MFLYFIGVSMCQSVPGKVADQSAGSFLLKFK